MSFPARAGGRIPVFWGEKSHPFVFIIWFKISHPDSSGFACLLQTGNNMF